MIRQLTLEDYPHALLIAKLRSRIGGTSVSTNLDEALLKYFNNENKISLGYFENDKLISWIAIGLHENKARGRFWYISFLFNGNIGNYYRFNKPENGLLLAESFTLAESLKYYEYYYILD